MGSAALENGVCMAARGVKENFVYVGCDRPVGTSETVGPCMELV